MARAFVSTPDGIRLDPVVAAHLAGLRYVTDDLPGIRRRREGAGFEYYDPDGARIRDSAQLQRFRAIAIPPAWDGVWICPLENGHLQATGRDARRRKQYRYHVAFRHVRDATKFHRMVAFGRVLPTVRAAIERDLSRRAITRERVLAAVLRLVDETHIRVGNDEYARQNHTYGATTISREHVRLEADRLVLEFRGKHGKPLHAEVRDPLVASVVRSCQELPGQRLFTYPGHGGRAVPVSSEDVNERLRELSSDDFSVKDFRTWGGSAAFVRAMHDGARSVKAAVEAVARELNNTPAVARSSYLHPSLLHAAAEGTLPPPDPHPPPRLHPEESAMLDFLAEDELGVARRTA